jgi:hypothetical protein
VDPAGTLWAVPELHRALAAISLGGPTRLVPMAGVPPDLDAESIAALGGGRFAVGTESDEAPRSGDRLLFLRTTEAGAEVEDEWIVPYDAEGFEAESNQGLEGLCVTDGVLLAATEFTREHPREGRHALLLRRRLDGEDDWHAFEARLTTGTGKLSALACRSDGTTIRVLAVERHYAVMRIVRYLVPLGLDGSRTLEPQLVYDLAGRFPDDPNFEGLAIVAGDAYLVTDNYYGQRQGDNELVRIPGVRF